MIKQRKFHNKKVEFNGRIFDSKKEMQRYVYLKSLQDKGEISDLQCQVPFLLIPKRHYTKELQLKTKIKKVQRLLFDEVTYVADFVYTYNGSQTVEDVKGSPKIVLPDFKLKQKMMMFIHNIEVHLIFNPTDSIPEKKKLD